MVRVRVRVRVGVGVGSACEGWSIVIRIRFARRVRVRTKGLRKQGAFSKKHPSQSVSGIYQSVSVYIHKRSTDDCQSIV